MVGSDTDVKVRKTSSIIAAVRRLEMPILNLEAGRMRLVEEV